MDGEKTNIEYLKDLIREGDTIYGIVRHVSSSGMSRSIDFIYIKDNKLLYLTSTIAKLLDYKIDNKNGGLKIGGCGMDMIFKVIYEVSNKIFEGKERAGYLINSIQL